MSQEELSYRDLISRIGATMIIFVALFYLFHYISALIYGLVGEFSASHTYIIFSYLLDSAAYLAAFMVPVAIFKLISKKKKHTLRAMDLTPHLPKNFPLIIMAGIAVTFAFSYINAMFMGIFEENVGGEIPYYARNMTYAYEYVLYFISIAIVPAFCEEFLFRGLVLKNLLPYGKTTAVIISSLLFGFMHQNDAQFLYTTFAGVVLALVYIETRSIWCSIFMHLFNNMISVLEEIVMVELNSAVVGYIIVAIEALIVLAGLVALVILIKDYEKKKQADRESKSEGFFGKEFEGDLSLTQNRLSTRSKIAYFCTTPAMLIFCIISYILMFTRI